MKLYERDFKTLTPEEWATWNELKKEEESDTKGNLDELILKKPIYNKLSISVRHYLSLFANNHLDPLELKTENDSIKAKLELLQNLVFDSDTTERDIHKFIRTNNAYFVIGAILKRNYSFGHHSIYVFPEFKLPPNFQVDYLIVGKNSEGYHFVFVELENPYGPITISDGSYGETIRKGIRQIEDWESWIEQNFNHLRLVFEQSLSTNQVLPKEFTVLDKSRIHFVVIAGRRSDYNDKTYRLRRNNLEQRKLKVIHYDNLIDYVKEVIISNSY